MNGVHFRSVWPKICAPNNILLSVSLIWQLYYDQLCRSMSMDIYGLINSGQIFMLALASSDKGAHFISLKCHLACFSEQNSSKIHIHICVKVIVLPIQKFKRLKYVLSWAWYKCQNRAEIMYCRKREKEYHEFCVRKMPLGAGSRIG